MFGAKRIYRIFSGGDATDVLFPTDIFGQAKDKTVTSHLVSSKSELTAYELVSSYIASDGYLWTSQERDRDKSRTSHPASSQRELVSFYRAV